MVWIDQSQKLFWRFKREVFLGYDTDWKKQEEFEKKQEQYGKFLKIRKLGKLK